MNLREVLSDYKFYAEIDKDNYGVFINKSEITSYGFIVRFKDIDSARQSILKLDKPYIFKAVPIKFTYRNETKNYVVVKEEFLSKFDMRNIEEKKDIIKVLVDKSKESIKKRENFNIKETDLIDTKLPDSIKKAGEISEKKNMYLNITVYESDKFNINLIVDRKNLFFRVYPKREVNLNIPEFEKYILNNRIYLIAPVRENESLESLKKKAEGLF